MLFGTEFDYLDLKNLSKKAGREITKHNINKYLQEQGYDGIINKGYDGKIHAYLVYDSNQIKSADPVTYDDDGNVIPLSERFKDDNKDIRYSVDDTIIDKYTNIDLSTLDANEIKVYNNRGWSYGLFSKEDIKLLNEKFGELNTKIKSRTDNVLGDGSRIIEVNNKLVLIGGSFEDPIIYDVFVVNSNNETETEIYKELLLNDTEENWRTKQRYIDICKSYEYYSKEETVRNYESADFSYHKGRKDTGERALLPNSFKNYGYTKQFQNGRGDSSETEQGISAVQISNEPDIKYAIDDTITDGFFSDDGDLFTDDGNVIPLSERFKDDNKDIRYSVDDTIIDKYSNIDLSTLDANEIRVYNNRGWSYSLFNNEDLKLLNEKFSELDSKYRTDNVLGDGSRVVEINNKLVLIVGTFKEPMMHGVLTVNSDSETEADYFKERLIYETKINKWDRYQFNDYCLSFESIVGKELVRYYDSADFSYRKGQRDTRERALLPNSFKNYGYTKQFQNGRGDSSETEQGISALQISNEPNIKYAIDDTITDGFFSDDGDLFTDDGNVIPLSERFKDDNKDIRYFVDDTIIDKYTNIDLSTLDANEIRVYNNR